MVRSSPPSKKHASRWDSFQMTMNGISVFRRQVRWQLGINSRYSLSLFFAIAFLQLQCNSGKTTRPIFAMISDMLFSTKTFGKTLRMKMSGTITAGRQLFVHGLNHLPNVSKLSIKLSQRNLGANLNLSALCKFIKNFNMTIEWVTELKCHHNNWNAFTQS